MAIVPKKYKSDHILSENKYRRQASIYVHTRYVVQTRGKKFRSEFAKNRVGHRRNATCSHHYLFNVWELFFGHSS